MGEFAKGQVHGRGILSFPEGHDNVKYDGQFVEGKHSGKGTMEWKDGRTYTGEFAEGQVHGKGILTFAGKFIKRHTGKFVKSLAHGTADLELAHGRKIKVDFDNGNLIRGSTVRVTSD